MHFGRRFMAIHLEMIAEFAHGTKKFLCLTGGFEFLHSTLSHTRHLMRVFRSIVCPFVGDVRC